MKFRLLRQTKGINDDSFQLSDLRWVVLQFFDGDKWVDVPIVKDEGDHPTDNKGK